MSSGAAIAAITDGELGDFGRWQGCYLLWEELRRLDPALFAPNIHLTHGMVALAKQVLDIETATGMMLNQGYTHSRK